MGRLIKAEFLKLSKSFGYKILLLCMFGLSVLLGLLMADSETGMASGYSAYLSALTDTQVFIVFGSIFAAIFVCNEFSNRTFGMSLFSGCLRRDILLSKAIVFLVGFMPLVFAEPVITCVIASIRKGFGDLNILVAMELIKTTILFIFGCSAIGGFCFMLAVLIKNSGGTIGAGIGIMVGMDLLGMIPGVEHAAKLTFMYQMGSLPKIESTGVFITVIAVTLAITLGGSVLMFQNSELK